MEMRLVLDADAQPMYSALDELARLWPRVSELDLDRLGEPGQLALQILEGAGDLGQAVALDFDSSAAAAGRMTVAVKPSQLFLDLLAALRAVDGEVHVVG